MVEFRVLLRTPDLKFSNTCDMWFQLENICHIFIELDPKLCHQVIANFVASI